MTQYFTPGVAEMLRHQVDPVFVHTYTLTQLAPTPDNPSTTGVDESTDAWGSQVEAAGTQTTNLPCLYMEESVVNVQPTGPVQINRAVLLVPSTDVASPGDYVSNVVTPADPAHNVSQTILLVGPVRIEDTHAVAPMNGGVIYKDCILREVAEVLG